MSPEQREFSIVVGGPLFQLLRQVGLCDDNMAFLQRRVMALALICWLPPFLLSMLQGQLFRGDIAVPFIFDFETHIRFLVAVPLLVMAEVVVHRRISQIVAGFFRRQLVADRDVAQFESALKSALRLRNSPLAEAVLLCVVYFVGIAIVWCQYTVLDVATWYATPSEVG